MGERETAEQRTQANGEQFDRFEQLTRRLLAVPKQEADKERAKRTGDNTGDNTGDKTDRAK